MIEQILKVYGIHMPCATKLDLSCTEDAAGIVREDAPDGHIETVPLCLKHLLDYLNRTRRLPKGEYDPELLPVVD